LFNDSIIRPQKSRQGEKAMKSSALELLIELYDLDMSKEESDKIIYRLKDDLTEIDEVESVNRVADLDVPEGSKSAGDFLDNLLKVEVTPANCIKVLKFLSDRLGNKPLKLRIKKPDGNEIELEASSREEFDYIRQQAQKFMTEL
jgi:hypothetical protein